MCKRIVYILICWFALLDRPFCANDSTEPLHVRSGHIVRITQPPNFESMTVAIEITTFELTPEGDRFLQKVKQGIAKIYPFHSEDEEKAEEMEGIEGMTITEISRRIEGTGIRRYIDSVYVCLVERVYLKQTEADLVFEGGIIQRIYCPHLRKAPYCINLKKSELSQYFKKNREGKLVWNKRLPPDIIKS